MGVAPVSALVGDGKISAGLSREGKLVCFFYPSVGAYDQIPYYTGPNANDPLFGAPAHLGCFPGLVSFSEKNAEVTWLNNDPNSQKSHKWEYPSFNFAYNVKNFKIEFDVFSLIDINTVVYSFKITNTSSYLARTGLAFYGLINPCRKNQNPNIYLLNTPFSSISIPGWTSEGIINVGYKNGNLVWGEKNQQVYCGFASTLPNSSIKFVDSKGCNLAFNQGCYQINYTTSENLADKFWEEWLYPIRNALMIWDLGFLQPGETRTFRVFITAGSSEVEVQNELNILRNTNSDQQKNEVKNWWNKSVNKPLIDSSGIYINKLTVLDPTGYQVKLLKWLVITNRLLADRNTGAIVASPILIPKYYPVWPRDASYQVITWITLGFKEIADNYFRKYLFSIPDFKATDKWYQCYDSQGKEYVGVPGRRELPDFSVTELGYNFKYGVLEEDQMANVLLAIWYYKQKFGLLPVDPLEIRKLANNIVKAINKTSSAVTLTVPKNEVKNTMSLIFSCQPCIDYIMKDLKSTYKYNIKAGLIRPSSDCYEFPGSISSNLIKITDIETNPHLIASRQSAYTNFQSVGALYAAADLLNESELLIQADELKKNAEGLFWNNNSNHFKIAFSNITGILYDDRLEDYYCLYAWPFQAYPFDDQKVISQNKYIISEYISKLNKIDPAKERIFYPMLLNCQIMGNINQDISVKHYLEKFDSFFQDPEIVSPINHYLPEAIGGLGDTKRLHSAWPLGWSNAFGIMYLLTKGGYRPPELIKSETMTLNNELYMKINVRLWFWCNFNPMKCINPSDEIILKPFCEKYHVSYSSVHQREQELFNNSSILNAFRNNLQMLGNESIIEYFSGKLVNDEASWEAFFNRNKEYLSF